MSPGVCVCISQAADMAQQVKAAVTSPDNLSSIPGTHIVDEKNWLLWVVLWPPHTIAYGHPYTYIQITIVKNKKLIFSISVLFLLFPGFFYLVICIYGSSISVYELIAYFLLATNNIPFNGDINFLFIHFMKVFSKYE